MAWRKRARLHKSEPAGFRFFQKTAGLALEMAAEKHQVEQQLSRSSAVSEIAQTVNAALDLDILLRLIILEVTKALHYEAGDIWLRDEKSQTLSLRASLGLSASARNALTGMQDAGGTVAGDDPEGYEDTAAFSRLPAPLAEEGLRSLVIAPLKAKNKLIGIMHLYGKSRRLFSGSARSLLRTWTNQAASAIESARMFEDTKRKAQELLALHEMAQIISETPHLKSALGQIVERVSTVLNVEKCWLMFLEERSQMLVAHPSAVGAVDEQLAALRIDARAAGVSSEVFRSGRPFYSNEAGQEPGVQAEFQGIFQLNNLMAMPLRSGERTLGVFLAANKRDRAAFTGNDVRFFRTLASEAAMIIQNANLFTQLRGSYRSFIQSVAEVLDQGHSRRVAGIAGMLAGQLRLSEEDIECIQVAGLLHDMGKGGDHARGLNHPEAGANLVAGIDFPWDVSALIQHHHARFDGQDAPDHLSGERIPLGSRIIAVADEVDHRLHAGEESRALDEMKRLAGTQFDPAVIAALEQAWEQVRRKL
jgi:putative nucleotidyltransferase with HDIG domain